MACVPPRREAGPLESALAAPAAAACCGSYGRHGACGASLEREAPRRPGGSGSLTCAFFRRADGSLSCPPQKRSLSAIRSNSKDQAAPWPAGGSCRDVAQRIGRPACRGQPGTAGLRWRPPLRGMHPGTALRSTGRRRAARSVHIPPRARAPQRIFRLRSQPSKIDENQCPHESRLLRLRGLGVPRGSAARPDEEPLASPGFRRQG